MTDRGWGQAARPGPTAPHTVTDPSDPGGATVPIFVYRCDCGNRFERLVPRDADAPACPACGSDTRKIPAGPRLGRMGGGKPAGPAAARADVPIPWRGVVGGGAEKGPPRGRVPAAARGQGRERTARSRRSRPADRQGLRRLVVGVLRLTENVG